jgi:carbohydrate kinase (thermoresistant glucokinase family)
VVPHEVVGMANGSKNIFVGTGGVMGIHRSHFLGAVYGMERMMGRADTPVRRVLNYASEHFGKLLPQIVYVQTVVNKNPAGDLVMRGMFIGDDNECFERAAALSLECNFNLMDREIKKAVVFLDPHEFHSTWLGNKSVYRTRMALADDAELIVLAPGVMEFGEDKTIDMLIRRYGYCGTPATLQAVKDDAELAGNLSAAAHLIHGSSEGRFRIRYCPGHLTREEIEGVHFEYGDLAEYSAKYDVDALKDGWNVVDGEEIFFVSNPGLGLWAYRRGREGTQMIVVLMGVSGSGKTTIGTLLAERAGTVFADADDYHPAANKAKMAAGNPLNDEDRQPWLEMLNGLLRGWFETGKGGVLACSALKEKYRETLAGGMPQGAVSFVLLDGSKELIAERLAARQHEYMNPKLLESQLATLEKPKDAFTVVNDKAPSEVVEEILKHVG